jgi:hypothetical protein
MARRGAGQKGAAWLSELAAQLEQLGAQLGHILAQEVRRHLESSIDVGAISQRLAGDGARNRRRGKRGDRSICKVATCGRPVLAKGLCRSHYYRERYRAQKAEIAGAGRGKGRAKGAGGRRRKAEPAEPEGTAQ